MPKEAARGLRQAVGLVPCPPRVIPSNKVFAITSFFRRFPHWKNAGYGGVNKNEASLRNCFLLPYIHSNIL